MQEKDVLDAMTSAYGSLTKAGRRVADYIFANPVDAQYMSITSLAEECGVAEATISRFCRALGFSGYNDFKLGLARGGNESAAAAEVARSGKVMPGDSILDMCKKLYAADTTAINQTLALVDEDSVRKATALIANARRVLCFGQGGSMVMAMEAWARFITVAPHFQCIEDAHMQAMAAALASPEDVILFFSYSGSTKDMLDTLRPARKRGAKVILVTHFAKSPAAALADAILLCGSKEGPLHSGSVAAKMGQLFIIDILFNEYCRVMPERTEESREATMDAISAKLL